jgi:glucosamine--fructose-6-phosphate aminotransferase (isomerizing)
MTQADVSGLIQKLLDVRHSVKHVIDNQKQLLAAADAFARSEHLFYLGRGLDWALASEGSLKLKEISYIHCEAYAAGELKHGTISLITDGIPVLALSTQDELALKMQSNIQEVVPAVRKSSRKRKTKGHKPR